MSSPTHETDVHDLSLGVIHALALLDVKALSYVQLRRLYAALLHVTDDVDTEILERSDGNTLGETVRLKSPKKMDNSE